jgi:DNA-directed RNA polymerase specialized sigma24 family protein
MVRQTTMDTERQRWAELNRRILNGDEHARREFLRQYAPGVRGLLRRQLGAVGLERLLNETLDGALNEIERGEMREPRDLVRFVRQVAVRGRRLKAQPGQTPHVSTAPILSAADHTLLRKRIQAADRALASLSTNEREILVSYYSRGFTKQDIEVEFNISVEEFENLRERLIEALSPTRIRKFPNASRPLLARRAAANGV